MKLQYIALSAAVFSMSLASCGDARFKIDGEVYGAEGKSLVLEKSDFHVRWIPVDSVKVGDTGKFSIKADAPASPDVYRLSLGDRFIYLPVDSVETLTLTTSAADFGSKFTLSGTPQAERMAAFEQELMAVNATDSAALASFKRDVYTKYIKDGQGSIVSYYVLTKVFDGKPLYNPADAEDAKYYAAVATQFDNYRPGDPHGQMVKDVSLKAMRARNSAFNRELARIYKAKGGSVEFYQVSFDPGQYEWREAAANLPWITVLDPQGTSSNAIIDYNVGSLPAVFIYDANGDLVERPESLSDLERKL